MTHLHDLQRLAYENAQQHAQRNALQQVPAPQLYRAGEAENCLGVIGGGAIVGGDAVTGGGAIGIGGAVGYALPSCGPINTAFNSYWNSGYYFFEDLLLLLTEEGE